jgi:hypothetical protein
MPALVRTKYESESGAIHSISLNPATNLIVGAAPAGAVTSPIKAKISKGTKEYGLRPRGVTIAKTFGVAPDTFTRTAFIPVLSKTVFATAAYQLNAVLTYKGTADWIIVGRAQEDY